MGVVYTKEQQQVIDLRNRNILVSAAAGSGKTAVLVERIIAQLTKDASPIDVDRLLVVTYTEAAAAEMKERIHKAIEKALEGDPDNVHLQRQATLVHNAQVTTIHSFCLSVIRDYFHTIDLDPGFRIAEEGELKLLKKDVLEEVLEKWYQEAAEAFIIFVESFATGKDDRKIEEIVLQLYEYSRSYPAPEVWLQSLVEKYHVEEEKDLEESSFIKMILSDVKNVLQDIAERLDFALEICKKEDGPQAYIPALEADMQMIKMLLKTDKFEEMQQTIENIKWARLGANRKKMIAEEDINAVKEIRKECKDQIEGLQKQFFYDSISELQKGMLAAKGNMKVLVTLVNEFSEAFTAKKQSRNMIDFSDMEHYALRILTQQGEDGFVPSAVAKEYQEKYLEIMIDEYQDSNYIQDTILTSVSTISQGKYNIFMVGDVKQSIYRFRLSRPELFIEKYNNYDTTDGVKQRIDLHKNFRSRREVLDSTNFVFQQIMTKEFGGIEYDDKAALHVGAEYKEIPGNETELCLIDITELPETINKREIEARAVARKIKTFVDEHIIYDKQAGVYRKAKYGDIVILTRSIKGWADVFIRVLSQEGVPAYSVSKEGYFETREIQMILNYLKILDNPRQDVPFAAALTGPFVGMKSEELAVIKSEVEEKTFYEKVCSYLECGKSEELKLRLQIFMTQYHSFRRKVPYTSIHDLLNMIIEETGYGNYIAALPAGEQRAANLEMLLEKAIAFESTSYKGLFHFVRYIEQLYKYEVDYGEANIVDETADVVRIMSIHKSKGLEFPIVFVIGMDKGFNLQDIRSSIVIHPELGAGIDYVDIEKRTKHPSILKKMIQKEVEKETIAEEMRVLYVAMTRAREKLILTGTISNIESKLKKLAYLNDRTNIKLPYSCIAMVKKYFDWLLPAVYRQNINDCVPIKVETILFEDLVLDEMIEEWKEEFTKQNLLDWDMQKEYDLNMKKQIEEQFSYVYPYLTEQRTKQKISVSELKKKVYMEEAEMEEEVVIPLLPKFLQEEHEITGASRGTAYHRVLELLDFSFDYTYEILEEKIEEMVQSEKITAETAKIVKKKDILDFLQSALGKRVQKAARNGKFHAEQPFVLAREKEDPDTVLIQGIIDVYFEEEDEIVVLDYKTDKVYQSEELIERYRTQLDYYAQALERLTGKKVKQKMIYSFTLRKEIEV